MRRLLDDLFNNRKQIEADQRATEQCRRETEVIDDKLHRARMELQKAKQKYAMLIEDLAIKSTELKTTEVKNRVMGKSFKGLEAEYNSALEDLQKLRLESSELASGLLNESMQFAMMWNGTELGRKSRIRYRQEEMENLERLKLQLEYELADFLDLQKGTEECEKQKEELEKKYKEHDEITSKQEKELKDQIDALDLSLQDLKKEEKEFVQSSNDEVETLKLQIEEIQDSVESLKDAARNTHTTANNQKTVCTTVTQSDNVDQQCGRAVSDSNGRQAKVKCGPKEVNETQGHKRREGKFHPPIKPRFGSSAKANTSSNSGDTVNSQTTWNEFQSNSNDDEDICMAAALEVSQSMKTKSYEPVTPIPSYAPPSKVRVVERSQVQVPITSFMKQVSSTRVIAKRPSKPPPPTNNSIDTSKNVKSIPQTHNSLNTQLSTSSGKSFQFKKKTSNRSENNSISDSSVNDEVNSSPDLYGDKPFSTFTSSRFFL